MSGSASALKRALKTHVTSLRECRACPQMIGPVISGGAVVSPVMLVGQAPGQHEGRFGRPFAWTAGKTMFGWFATIGLDEEAFRSRVYMAAVCRCFPGKNPKGGDRVPSREEIAACGTHLARELDLLTPELVVPVGKLAIGEVLGTKLGKLDQVIGGTLSVTIRGRPTDVIALPHPSGASTWHRTEPGKTLLQRALATLGAHPAWRQLL